MYLLVYICVCIYEIIVNMSVVNFVYIYMSIFVEELLFMEECECFKNFCYMLLKFFF